MFLGHSPNGCRCLSSSWRQAPTQQRTFLPPPCSGAPTTLPAAIDGRPPPKCIAMGHRDNAPPPRSMAQPPPPFPGSSGKHSETRKLLLQTQLTPCLTVANFAQQQLPAKGPSHNKKNRPTVTCQMLTGKFSLVCSSTNEEKLLPFPQKGRGALNRQINRAHFFHFLLETQK